MPTDELAHLAYELYAHVPGDFVAARNALAARLRQEGDRELATQVRALPKATVAAWAVGAVVRRQPGEVDALGELGAELRVAQGMANAAELRALSRRRRERVAAATETTVGLAAENEVTVSVAAREQVMDVWQAVVVHPDAERAVRTGLLVRAIGPGEDLVDVLAVPEVLEHIATRETDRNAGVGPAADGREPAGARAGAPADSAEPAEEAGEPADSRRSARPSAAQAREIRRLRRAVKAGERAVTLAAQELAAVEEERARLEAEGLHLAARIDELQRELAALEERAEDVEEARAGAEEEVEDAQERHRAAEEELTELRGRLTELED